MKALLLFLTLLPFSYSAYSQKLFGVMGTTSSINTYKIDSSSMHPKVGFAVGLGYEYQLKNQLSVYLGLNYVQRSFQSNYSGMSEQRLGNDVFYVTEKQQNRFRLDYIELPVMLKFNLFHENFFLIAGPSLAFGLGGKFRYEQEHRSTYLGASNTSGSKRIKYKEGIYGSLNDMYFSNRWDFGAQVGIGAFIFKKFQIEVRYYAGMVNLEEVDSSRNKSLQISVAGPLNRLK